jgi:hypothetical protein
MKKLTPIPKLKKINYSFPIEEVDTFQQKWTLCPVCFKKRKLDGIVRHLQGQAKKNRDYREFLEKYAS